MKIHMFRWHLLALLFFLAVSIFRYSHSLFHTFDTGLYLQLAYNIIFNGSLGSSVTGAANFLAVHFQPSFVLISPLVASLSNPIVLSLISCLSIFAACMVVYQETKGDKPDIWIAILTMILIFHPSISGRIWYNFAPDILALPALTWLAFRLHSEKSRPIWMWMIVLIWSGGSKEFFWLVGAWVCIFRAYVFKSERVALGALALLQIATFVTLYFYWMPKHSDSTSYISSSFYFPSGHSGYVDAVGTLLSNFFSMRSLKTFLLVAVSFGLIPFMKFSFPLLGAIPGICSILMSHSDQIHHIGNHYLIPVVPFLLVASISTVETIDGYFRKISISRWWLVIPALLFTLFYNGVLDSIAIGTSNPRTRFFREAAIEFSKKYYKDDHLLVIDGGLQVHVPHIKDSIVLLSFTGNPRRLSKEELNGEFYVLTSEDLKKIEDCSKVSIGSNLDWDKSYFRDLCRRIKNDSTKLVFYENGGLHGYFVENK